MNGLVAGTLAGLVATAPMTATMLLLRRLAPETRHAPLPPEAVTEEAAERVDLRDDLGESGVDSVAWIGHFAYGAAAGTLYAPLARSPRPVPTGIAVGLALWAVGYLGWVPAFGLMPPATEQPAARNALMIAAHAVWGGTTAALAARLVAPSGPAAGHGRARSTPAAPGPYPSR